MKHNQESVLENATQNSPGFSDSNGSPNLCQATRPCDNQQKKRTYRTVNVAVLADHRVKLKEVENKDKYIDLARELKKLYNMKLPVIPIVTGALSTVTKD